MYDTIRLKFNFLPKNCVSIQNIIYYFENNVYRYKILLYLPWLGIHIISLDMTLKRNIYLFYFLWFGKDKCIYFTCHVSMQNIYYLLTHTWLGKTMGIYTKSYLYVLWMTWNVCIDALYYIYLPKKKNYSKPIDVKCMNRFIIIYSISKYNSCMHVVIIIIIYSISKYNSCM